MDRVGRAGRSFRAFTLTVGALMAVSSCSTTGDDSAVELGSGTVISYQFLDSSVPPRYHRSYELRVTSSESRIVVDSYGDILADQSMPTDPEVWRELGGTIDHVTGLRAEPAAEGCTGGTVTSLAVVDGDRVMADLMLEDCGAVNAANVEDVQTWIAPARDQFPPMDQLAPEGP